MSHDFDDFFLREYDRISEAYFKTVASISEFMKHYMTIVSVPPALLVLMAKPQEMAPVVQILRQHPLAACLPLLVIAVVGFFLCRYLIALALNAHLYARTVNGVRAHFAAKIPTDDGLTPSRIVLPLSTKVPSFSSGTINHVVVAMAIVNTGYAWASAFLLHRLTRWPGTFAASWVIPVFVFSAHFISYQIQARAMEHAWSVDRQQT